MQKHAMQWNLLQRNICSKQTQKVLFHITILAYLKHTINLCTSIDTSIHNGLEIKFNIMVIGPTWLSDL